MFVANFREEFSEVPRMEVGLYGLDFAFSDAGVRLEVDAVTESGFRVRAVAPVNALIYFVAVDFVAYIEDEGYDSDSFSYSDFDQEQRNTWTSGNNERFALKTLPTPGDFTSPGAISFISSIQFNSRGNVRFQTNVQGVEQSGTEVKVGTWADTGVVDFRVSVLWFDKTDVTNAFYVSTDKTGPMNSGKDERHDAKIQENIPARHAQFFAALSYIDFINGHNYRLSQKHTHGKDWLKTDYKTWADTLVWRVRDSVMYTPIYAHEN